MHVSGRETAHAAFGDVQLQGGSFGKLQEKRLFFYTVGNPAESVTLLSQFVLGHTSKALAFNSLICSTYLAALPVFALLGTVIRRSSCLIKQWP